MTARGQQPASVAVLGAEEDAPQADVHGPVVVLHAMATALARAVVALHAVKLAGR
jgi:hypothetical protein